MAADMSRPAATTAERPLALLPVFVALDKDKELREQFLLDANISRPALEGVASKLHSEMGLQQEESRAEIQGILARQLRVFRDAGGGTTAGGGGLVQLQIMQKLNSKLVFLDVLDVDLNAPLTDVAAYFVAVCRDFGFPHVVYVALVEKARAGIAAARAKVAAGTLTPRPAPDLGAVVQPSQFPALMPKSKYDALIELKARASRTGAGAPAPVKAEATAEAGGGAQAAAGQPAAQPAAGSLPKPSDTDMPDF